MRQDVRLSVFKKSHNGLDQSYAKLDLDIGDEARRSALLSGHKGL